MTIRTEEPVPPDVNPIRLAWIQRQCMAMFVICLRIAVAAGEVLEDLAYPEFVGINQQEVDGHQEQIVMHAYVKIYVNICIWGIDMYVYSYVL